MGSCSSTDGPFDGPPAVAGFRIEGVVGRGPRGVVYEAVQRDLERPVALKVLPRDALPADRLRSLAWPNHPNAVQLYAAGVAQDGGYLAMQRVRGPTLAAARDLPPSDVRAALAGAAAALDSLHAQGRAHGSVHAGNVFVDGGRGLLSDFGLRTGSPEDDRVAFAALVREVVGDDEISGPIPGSASAILAAARPAARGRRVWTVAGTAAAALTGVIALTVALSSSGPAADRPPPVLKGAVALGSALTARHVEAVDCTGRQATGSSEACTIVQTELSGIPVVAHRSGVIRRWAVRGAGGSLALDVLRRRGSRYFLAARSPFAQIADDGVHVEPANLPIRPGDLVGLEVTPGAAIGVADARGAATARWFGPIVLTVRGDEHGARPPLSRELLLRVEFVPGARWRPAGELTGPAAAGAPAGHVLARVDLDGGRRVEVIKSGSRVAVDLLRGRRRVSRLPVAGADPDGRVLAFGFAQLRFGQPIARLQWRNADGPIVEHDYLAGSRRFTPIT